jgi:hypothetical protein
MSVISSKRVRTRKPHQCWACGDTFESGVDMMRVTEVEHSEGIWSTYYCLCCDEYLDKVVYYEDGIELCVLANHDDYKNWLLNKS